MNIKFGESRQKSAINLNSLQILAEKEKKSIFSSVSYVFKRTTLALTLNFIVLDLLSLFTILDDNDLINNSSGEISN